MKAKLPPPVIMLLFVLLIAGLSKKAPLYLFSVSAFSIVGGFFLLLGLVVTLYSFFLFLKVRTTPSPINLGKSRVLVTSGFYRFSRNPMYLGMLSILLGAAFFFRGLSGFLVLPLFVLAINELQIKPEEGALAQLFGETYQTYKQSVRRWL